jgi:murein DD-endopeptidase MepM/ murein hydrolase activator NlpD
MSTWIRPVEAKISDTFGKHVARKSVNPGVDYMTAVGVPVKALADGTVARVVETIKGAGGRMVLLDFPSGHKADYLHLSRVDVKAGDAVKQGQVLGLSGASGLGKERGYGPHLHLSFRMGGTHASGAGNIDYEAFIGGAPAAPAAPAKPAAAPAKPAAAASTRPGPAVARAVIRQGSTGEDVKYLQGKLGITADGTFGPRTRAAVVAFQSSKGLTTDGIVGKNTWRVIG